MITTLFAANGCANHGFLGFPTWYEYLPSANVGGLCSPQLSSISDVWLIVAAGIEILLRIAALAAVAFVIYGGIKYTTSQGNPDDTSKAKTSIINAIAGLFISISAAIIVQFIAGRFN